MSSSKGCAGAVTKNNINYQLSMQGKGKKDEGAGRERGKKEMRGEGRGERRGKEKGRKRTYNGTSRLAVALVAAHGWPILALGYRQRRHPVYPKE